MEVPWFNLSLFYTVKFALVEANDISIAIQVFEEH